jgi:hypothetical protein
MNTADVTRDHPAGTETFGSKIGAMVKDLKSVRDRMEKDDSDELAALAQEAFIAVRKLKRGLREWGEGLAWDWEPEASDD